MSLKRGLDSCNIIVSIYITFSVTLCQDRQPYSICFNAESSKKKKNEVEDVPDPEPLANITKVCQTLKNIDDVSHKDNKELIAMMVSALQDRGVNNVMEFQNINWETISEIRLQYHDAHTVKDLKEFNKESQRIL
jgi:hypothetical protein